MAMPSPLPASILHDPKLQRFATSDGKAYLEYRLIGGEMTKEREGEGGLIELWHTYVPPEKRGGGVAGKLCTAAMAHARENSLRVLPSCSYVSDTFLPRHPEFADLLAKSKSGL